MFGLLNRDINYILEALTKFNEIEEAIIFGSRALGNYKKGSDIDIAIVGKNITSKTIYLLDDYLNEIYPIPYFFDVIHFDALINENLKNHIINEGKILYTKKVGSQL